MKTRKIIFYFFSIFILISMFNGVWPLNVKAQAQAGGQSLEYKYVGTCKVNVLNIRSGPDFSYKVISSIKKNEEVDVLKLDNNWVKISTNETFGYVFADHLEIIINYSLNSIDINIEDENSYSKYDNCNGLKYILLKNFIPIVYYCGWHWVFIKNFFSKEKSTDMTMLTNWFLPKFSVYFIILLVISIAFSIYIYTYFEDKYSNFRSWLITIELSYPFFSYALICIAALIFEEHFISQTLIANSIIYFTILIYCGFKKRNIINSLKFLCIGLAYILCIQYLAFLAIILSVYVVKLFLIVIFLALVVLLIYIIIWILIIQIILSILEKIFGG